ncbi:MAG: radical SAM protein [Candidatus Omnitrophica bacterium]|nr:radical SAM protein [Candidatus Omnitrophota bacterium]
MKILLANLPWKKGRNWGVRAGSRWPHIKTPLESGYLPFPFFLAYAAALLQREGFMARVVDAIAEEISVDEFMGIVRDGKWDLLVVETSTPSLLNDMEVISRLPADLPVVLCGPEASIRTPDFLEQHPAVRFVMAGEYEMTLLDLVRSLAEKRKLSEVSGLVWKEGAAVRINPPRPLLENLDDLPWPMREGLPMHRYNDRPGGIPAPSVQMWSSRGCPYQCAFCAWPQLMYGNRRYRTRGIVNVVDEMEYLVRKAGFRSIYFDDDTTNIGKLRMAEFAREIMRRELKVPWAMMARADIMDEDMLLALRAAGLEAVKYGVESADQRLLDNIGKGMDLAKAERMIRFTKSLGIKTHLTFSFGLPGETKETVQKTIDLALELDPDSLQFSINTAFPGTSYYRELELKGFVVSSDPKDYDGNARSMLRTESLDAQDLGRAKSQADAAWQAHLWRTRQGNLSAGKYAGKFMRHFVQNGAGEALTRAAAYLRSKLAAWCGRLFGITGGLYGRAVGRVAVWQGIWVKVRRNALNLLGIFHGERAFKGPDCVQIDVTGKCNNNCVSCWCNSPLLGERRYRGARSHKTLPALLVQGLIDELAAMGTRELFFSGGGEPFMHPGFMEILAHAKARGMHCCVNTNFTLVNEELVRRIIAIGLDEITVSVWAASAGMYVLTHPNRDEATFFRLKATLAMLNMLKGAKGPRVKVYNVISNLNYAEVESMVDFAEEVGADSVEFTVVDTIPGATDVLILDRDQRAAVLKQCDSIRRKKARVQVLNLEHFMRRLSDNSADQAQYDSGFLGKTPCYVGWTFSRVMSDGDVNFCLKAHRVPVGNLYRNSFAEIWNSARQQEFRCKALRFDPKDEFFRMIGNDDKCKVGCHKSCDDIGRNMHMHRMVESTPATAKLILQAIAWLKK